MKNVLKKIVITGLAVLICFNFASCVACGTPEERAAAKLFKALESGNASSLEKALAEAGSAGITSLVSASASPGGDFSYDLNEDETGVVIMKYTGSGSVVIVPETIEDYPVVGIAARAFAGTHQYKKLNMDFMSGYVGVDNELHEGTGDALTAVILPDSITYINSGAFRECTRLHTINIPASITFLGDGIFDGCTYLYNFTIPEAVTNIEFGNFGWGLNAPGEDNIAFRNCGKLKLATRSRIKELGYTGSF